MNKAFLAAALALAANPGIAAASSVLGPHYGRKARFGQFAEEQENGNKVDRAERINFNRSKYIPGNGPDHRLGRDNPECLKRGD